MKGKPKLAYPKLSSWDITRTANHWANEESMKRYIRNITVPYVEKTKQEIKLSGSHRALCIMDNFSS